MKARKCPICSKCISIHFFPDLYTQFPGSPHSFFPFWFYVSSRAPVLFPQVIHISIHPFPKVPQKHPFCKRKSKIGILIVEHQSHKTDLTQLCTQSIHLLPGTISMKHIGMIYLPVPALLKSYKWTRTDLISL